MSAQSRTSWHRLMVLLTVACALLGLGCSVPDPEDMTSLEQRIGSMPADQRELLAVWATTGMVHDWLTANRYAGAGYLDCVHKTTGEKWSSKLITDQWLQCMNLSGGFDAATFHACTELIIKSLNPLGEYECKARWSNGFDYNSIRQAAIDRYNQQFASGHATMAMLIATFLVGSATPPPVPIDFLLPTLCGRVLGLPRRSRLPGVGWPEWAAAVARG